MDEFSRVFFGCDTRVTSKALIETAISGCDAIGSLHTDYGVLTTPQLHHCVRMINKDNKALASVEGYNQLVVRSVKELIEGHEYKNRGTLHVDCANGVGFIGWTPLARLLKEYISIELRNTGDGVLNYHCGSEFTQKQQTFPDSYDGHNDKLERCCCMDGDADRLVYFYSNSDEKFCLLDGDKVAALFGLWIHSKLEILKITDKVNMGVVETSYANGSASEFLRKNNIPLSFAKTGVKFVHHEAQKYDIGIYFEANGHGTAIFNNKTLELLRTFDCKDDTQKRAVRDLLSAYQLINQATGDAMTDALMVECILIQRKITHMDWDKMYTSLPSRQSVLKVPSRYDVVCNDSETACVKPVELQNKINDLCKAVKCGRAFVRPSGTEDVVRIYAEADTQENADKLAQDVIAAAKSILG